MKKSPLKKIQDTVAKYAEIISQVLKVDLEIVDADLVRIAGTGKYMDIFDIDVHEEGHIYKDTMTKGVTQVIEDPVTNQLCSQCNHKDTCNEKLIACTPIIMDGEAIGLIGLICFDEIQRQWFIDNFHAYASFLEQIAEFISIKAYETLENERSETMVCLLNTIFEKLNDAIIVMDKEHRISYMNQEAEKTLKIKSLDNSHVILTHTGNEWLGHPEFSISVYKEGTSQLVVGSLHDINMKVKKYDKVFIFSDVQTMRSKLIRISNVENSITLDHIIGKSDKMTFLKNKVLQISKSTSTILITGESGTGKEMLARAIHSSSDRRDEPFVAINCGAIPDSLLESELFGYDKGSFTGASSTGKIGKFEFANKGTLFLDEIGDMPLYMQVKILRVLQEREIMKIGSNKPIKVDIRIIAATNKHLEYLIKEGAFRKDLYYRLNVIPFEMPPLRERIEDVQPLMTYFLNKYATLFNKHFTKVDKDVLEALLSYDWPGNIRELENTTEFMVNMMDDQGVVTLNNLPAKFLTIKSPSVPLDVEDDIETIELLEKRAIIKALNRYGYNSEGKNCAALKLGIGIATLYRKIQKYEIEASIKMID